MYNIALGDFDIHDFQNAPGSPLMAVLLFVLFMFVVPIVMLNALIAIMVSCFLLVGCEKRSKLTSVCDLNREKRCRKKRNTQTSLVCLKGP
eukprot:COSAG02_NODE_5429_length_4336_cov_5155.868539_2_plen_91_part_00